MQQEYEYELRIPKERIAVLVGTDGTAKKEIEQKTQIKLNIDSKEGLVIITGTDGLHVYAAKEVVLAIARGFNPQIALQLLKIDYILEIINAGQGCNTKNELMRLLGRIIGKDGKSRELIEELTETDIVIFGKTVSIIGEAERALDAKRAVEMLLQGANHASVYSMLEKKKKQRKMRDMFKEGETSRNMR